MARVTPQPSLALCSFSYGTTNGIARMDQILATGLKSAGFSVEHFVIQLHGPFEAPEAGDIRFLELDQAYKILREEFERTDAVLFNGSLDPCVTFAASEAGVPVLAEIMHQNERGGMYDAVDCVVCVSDFVREKQTHPSCAVIPNGIDLERFRFKPGRRDEQTAHIVQIANQSKPLHFSLDGLIPDILGSHPNTRFTALGGRTLAAHPALAAVSAQNDMETVYHEADLNFLACKNDAFGLTLLEGMACGCLPVGSTDGGAREFIRHGETGWLVQGNRNDWLDALGGALKKLGGPEHLNMQERAREQVAALYSREKCIERYVQLLGKLSAKFPGRRKRTAPQAWRPLMEAAFLAGHDLNSAVSRVATFVLQDKTLEPELFKHPNGPEVLSRVMQMLLGLENSQIKSLLSAFCLLLRRSRVQGDLIDALEAKAK